jgi:ribonuclease HII
MAVVVYMTRETPPLRLEQELWAQGKRFIGGIDEAGRGAWVGPVCAAVVILPANPEIIKPLACVRDSKLLSPLHREQAADCVKTIALGWSIGYSSAREIDEIGILPATRQAVLRSIQSLTIYPEFLLMDYIHWPGLKNPHLMFPKGESLSLSIASASVIAKTSRDALMRELDLQYPGYGFAKHKGYGTREHQQAINRLGLCDIHRKSFSIGQQRDSLSNE